MKEQLATIRSEALAAFAQAGSSAELDALRVKYLGKKGELTAVLKQMGKLSAEERPAMGQLANEVRAALEAELEAKGRELEAKALEARLEAEALDVTVPGKPVTMGHRHPMYIALDELKDIFIGMGFTVLDGPEVELAEYNGIPHLLMPVVTEPKKAAGALGSAVQEMERRYHLFAENNVRDIKSFNKLAAERPDLEKMPYIAIIIDELADLMMVVGKDVEDSICRIAQKARAAGMHLIVATQRPSVDVITGLIKANIPSRIAFAVSSQVDSRTILDGSGAEKLLGMGDMLFMPVGAPKPTRIQGTFVRDEEISRVLDFIKQSGTVQYDEAMIEAMEKHAIQDGKKGSGGADSDEDPDTDPMFKQAVEVVIDAGQASTSLLQRRCKLGYARAARIMDEMEQKGIIGPYEGAKPRAVLISRQQWLEMQMNQPEE